jgi:hypothetical protein
VLPIILRRAQGDQGALRLSNAARVEGRTIHDGVKRLCCNARTIHSVCVGR